MKKIIVALGLTLTSLVGFSQSKISTYKNCVGYLNKETREYDYEPYTYGHITFTIGENYITADDVAHSIYKIIKRIPDSEQDGAKVLSVSCTDEKNVDCVVAFMKPAECKPASVGVIYNDIMYIYIIEQNP